MTAFLWWAAAGMVLLAYCLCVVAARNSRCDCGQPGCINNPDA